MEIEVGEYIRTISGDIYKYDETNQYILDCDLFYNRIVKHSKNIIDLIEIRDYVNNYLIYEISYDEKMNISFTIFKTPSNFKSPVKTIVSWENKDIKSIVTKEQFESMKYEIN